MKVDGANPAAHRPAASSQSLIANPAAQTDLFIKMKLWFLHKLKTRLATVLYSGYSLLSHFQTSTAVVPKEK